MELRRRLLHLLVVSLVPSQHPLRRLDLPLPHHRHLPREVRLEVSGRRKLLLERRKLLRVPRLHLAGLVQTRQRHRLEVCLEPNPLPRREARYSEGLPPDLEGLARPAPAASLEDSQRPSLVVCLAALEQVLLLLSRDCLLVELFRLQLTRIRTEIM